MSTEPNVKNVRIVGIAGNKNVGKSTTGGLLRELIYEQTQSEETDVQVLAFADPIKDAYAAMFGISRAWLEVGEFKDEFNSCTGTTHRRGIQTLGSEWGRGMHTPHVWVNVMREKIAKAISYQEVKNLWIIVTDVRFENEAELLKNYKNTVFLSLKDSTVTDVSDSHPSETPLDIPGAHVIDVKKNSLLMMDGQPLERMKRVLRDIFFPTNLKEESKKTVAVYLPNGKTLVAPVGSQIVKDAVHILKSRCTVCGRHSVKETMEALLGPMEDPHLESYNTIDLHQY